MMMNKWLDKELEEEFDEDFKMIDFLLSLDSEAREKVIREIELYHYIVDDYEDELEGEFYDEWN